MGQIASKFSLLRSKLESVAFLVAQEGTAKGAHKEIVNSLILLSEIETSYPTTEVVKTSNEFNVEEVKKVGRKLKLWAKRPNQINSKILTAYLKLERAGSSTITEDDLRKELADETTFESNFAQMKIIAKKNHGKVFDQYGAKIELWPPVISKIREFESVVFETK